MLESWKPLNYTSLSQKIPLNVYKQTKYMDSSKSFRCQFSRLAFSVTSNLLGSKDLKATLYIKLLEGERS